eukprot:TRINITY_DN19674_c0_g1_i1.p1 TRINITY_DN19674_c0_g1~~TRINITY_DN19674_c0_g1_i1.p1  ORF type:complete len:220 (-),score=37.58 TRINITY_DN19674_c0_g1_i1:73-681(-)
MYRVRALTCFLLVSALAAHKEEQVQVECSTTVGKFTVTVTPSYSPLGVARFLELVDAGFFTDMLLYRVIEGFLVQFGVASEPEVQARYQNARIKDEPNKVPFRAGTLSFAGSGADSRSCHLFVALEPNGARLGSAKHETTLGHVDEEGLETFKRVVENHKDAGYGDTGHLQGALVKKGNGAADQFQKLDKILSCQRLLKQDL